MFDKRITVMKKRFFKALCVLMLIVMAVGVLAGCTAGVFAVNTEKYRERVMITVGQIEVTVGEFSDWFSMNAAQYVDQYGMQEIWDGLYPSFLQQKMLVNEVLISNPEKNESALANFYKNAGIKYVEYVGYDNPNDKNTPDRDYKWEQYANVATGFPANATEADKLVVFVVKSLYVSLLETLDTATETVLTDKGFVFDAAETEETRADMVDRGELEEGSLWANELKIDDQLKELDKKLEKYLKQDFGKFDVNYIFAANHYTLVGEGMMLEKLNERLNKDDDADMADVTAQDYIAAQKEALRTTLNGIKMSGSKTMTEYFKKAVGDQLESQMATMAQIPYYKRAEGSINKADFEARMNLFAMQFTQKYATDKAAFEAYVRSLGSTSFVYGIPNEFVNQYHFVVNLLLPFSEEQSAGLAAVKSESGTAWYNNYRLNLAKKIAVKEFSSEEPEGTEKWSDPTRFVSFGAGGISVNPSWASSITSLADFKKEVYLYNTDPGALNATYEYVVGLHEFDLTDKDKEVFVKEFADAGRSLALANAASASADKMIACVTDFGIHIMYYSGPVTADFTYDTASSEWRTADGKSAWSERYNYGIEGGNAAYRFFVAYYTELRTDLVAKEVEKMLKLYEDGSEGRKITINEKDMKKMLKDTGIKFENKYSKA